jgi:hypothetical protein
VRSVPIDIGFCEDLNFVDCAVSQKTSSVSFLEFAGEAKNSDQKSQSVELALCDRGSGNPEPFKIFFGSIRSSSAHDFNERKDMKFFLLDSELCQLFGFYQNETIPTSASPSKNQGTARIKLFIKSHNYCFFPYYIELY